MRKHLTYIIETLNINQETVSESLQLRFAFSKLSVAVESGVLTVNKIFRFLNQIKFSTV
jgi:ssDNA-specific exonuclease RecJ